MLEPPIPPDEQQRLAVLRSLHILDTPPEERFDRITRTAQRLFNVPIALISLIDAHRQWFKSCQGLPVSETPRGISFCGHAILADTPLIIPDALLDPRFADNPLVTGEPRIRFYAGDAADTGDCVLGQGRAARPHPGRARHTDKIHHQQSGSARHHSLSLETARRGISP